MRLGWVGIVTLCTRWAGGSSSLIFVTDDMDNDVVSLLRSEHGSAGIRRSPSPDAALRDSATGDTILFLADGYPHEQLAAPVLAAATDDRDLFWRQAAAKELGRSENEFDEFKLMHMEVVKLFGREIKALETAGYRESVLMRESTRRRNNEAAAVEQAARPRAYRPVPPPARGRRSSTTVPVPRYSILY